MTDRDEWRMRVGHAYIEGYAAGYSDKCNGKGPSGPEHAEAFLEHNRATRRVAMRSIEECAAHGAVEPADSVRDKLRAERDEARAQVESLREERYANEQRMAKAGETYMRVYEDRASIAAERDSIRAEVARLRESLEECGVEGFAGMEDEKVRAWAESPRSTRYLAQRELRRRAALAARDQSAIPLTTAGGVPANLGIRMFDRDGAEISTRLDAVRNPNQIPSFEGCTFDACGPADVIEAGSILFRNCTFTGGRDAVFVDGAAIGEGEQA